MSQHINRCNCCLRRRLNNMLVYLTFDRLQPGMSMSKVSTEDKGLKKIYQLSENKPTDRKLPVSLSMLRIKTVSCIH